MPVICWVLTSEDKEGRIRDDRETYHHDKCIPFEKPAVQVRHEANSKRSNRSRNITLIREFSPHKMVCHPSYAGNGDQEQLPQPRHTSHQHRSNNKINKKTHQFLTPQNSPKPQAQEETIARHRQKRPPQTRRSLPPWSLGVMGLITSIICLAYNFPTDDRLVQFSPDRESEPKEE
jgi:hypothetical protein